METQLEKLALEALKRTVSERVAFASLLLDSLGSDAEPEQAWAVEVGQRASDIDNGIGAAIPMADALEHVWTRLT